MQVYVCTAPTFVLTINTDFLPCHPHRTAQPATVLYEQPQQLGGFRGSRARFGVHEGQDGEEVGGELPAKEDHHDGISHIMVGEINFTVDLSYKKRK